MLKKPNLFVWILIILVLFIYFNGFNGSLKLAGTNENIYCSFQKVCKQQKISAAINECYRFNLFDDSVGCCKTSLQNIYNDQNKVVDTCRLNSIDTDYFRCECDYDCKVEFTVLPTTADLNCDQCVGYSELISFADKWINKQITYDVLINTATQWIIRDNIKC